jgi:hypothetical protein
MVNRLFQEGDLIAPLPMEGTDFPVVQYADDTLLIMQASESQLLALKNLLHSFSNATGLKVNYNKSCILPINVSDQRMEFLAAQFGCVIGTLPFTYLGLPLGTTKPTIEDFTPLMSQIERRLNASARFLNYGGRLELVNSVLASLTTYQMCSIKLQKTVIKYCERAMRHCLWAKKDDEGQVTCNSLASWSMVCRPKKQGGLGIKNLELQNEALLLKQLHKFFCNEDIPWVKLVQKYGQSLPHTNVKKGSFWWRDVLSLLNIYRSITSVQIGNGNSVLFWKDFWHNGLIMCDVFPRLFSYVLNEDLSVKDFLGSGELGLVFSLPLSVEAFEELQQLNDITAGIILHDNEPDKRIFAWGSDKYTSARFYKFMFNIIPQNPSLCLIWKSKTMPKLKVFSWLVFMDRVNSGRVRLCSLQ